MEKFAKLFLQIQREDVRKQKEAIKGLKTINKIILSIPKTEGFVHIIMCCLNKKI